MVCFYVMRIIPGSVDKLVPQSSRRLPYDNSTTATHQFCGQLGQFEDLTPNFPGSSVWSVTVEYLLCPPCQPATALPLSQTLICWKKKNLICLRSQMWWSISRQRLLSQAGTQVGTGQNCILSPTSIKWLLPYGNTKYFYILKRNDLIS